MDTLLQDQHEKSTRREWAGYARAAGLGAFALGAGGVANATIIINAGTYEEDYSGDPQPPVFDIVIDPVTYTGGAVFDIDGDGTADVRLGTGSYNSAFADDGGPGATGPGTVFTSGPNTSYAAAFAANALIDSSAVEASVSFGSQILNSSTFTSGGYLGVQTASGNFGWMDLLIEPGAVSGNTRITVRGWAYEDSGAAIAAGAVPEPSSLVLLAVGAAACASRRHKLSA